jgi:hypothetical protein
MEDLWKCGSLGGSRIQEYRGRSGVKLQKRIRLINGDQGDIKGDEREIKGDL